jgi:hypothetical protein
MEWTQSWKSFYVGKLVWSAFVRPGHPLVLKSKHGVLHMEDLNASEFIAPCYWLGTDIKEGEDGYPIPLSRRNVVTYAQSAITALEIARVTDAVVFAPNIVSKQQAELGLLSRLHVEGTEDCFQKVFLSNKLKERFLKEMQKVLE